MRWIAILYGRIKADLAATSGIHHAEDVVKMLLVGARVTMLCSVLLHKGIEHLPVLERTVRQWLDEREAANRVLRSQPEVDHGELDRLLRELTRARDVFQGRISFPAPELKRITE